MPLYNPPAGFDDSAVYRELCRVQTRMWTGVSGAMIFDGGSAGLYTADPFTVLAPGIQATLPLIDILASDLDLSAQGKTTKLNLVVTQLTGHGAAPAITYTYGIYPLAMSAAGAANTVQIDRGTVVAGSTAAIASPAIDTRSRVSSGDFDLPSDGSYGFGCSYSGIPNASSGGVVFMSLRVRHV